ncbi:hypothetical protein TNIN_124041 [Trichonephila inaurata madagascariensis]|uniref:Uncharacterized protein n=1 Tax=Trichonephila inaurata madagascariensis TaxID=2747483 RepID=A0A8X6XIB6_9ARAC|nr:hypothetical protein TNIN_124041 [Trichonephila inaurata madagascariensis]
MFLDRKPFLLPRHVQLTKEHKKEPTGHLFLSVWPTEQHLGGKQFVDEDDVQDEILLRMTLQPKEFYAPGTVALIKRRDKCINVDGDTVKK